MMTQHGAQLGHDALGIRPAADQQPHAQKLRHDAGQLKFTGMSHQPPFQIAVIGQPRLSASASTGSSTAGSTTIVSKLAGSWTSQM